jgi:hypothetical protein
MEVPATTFTSNRSNHVGTLSLQSKKPVPVNWDGLRRWVLILA